MERPLSLALIVAGTWLAVTVQLALRDFDDAGLVVAIGLAATLVIVASARLLLRRPRTLATAVFVLAVALAAFSPALLSLLEGDGGGWAALPAVLLGAGLRWLIGWDRVGRFGESTEEERRAVAAEYTARQRSTPHRKSRRRRKG